MMFGPPYASGRPDIEIRPQVPAINRRANIKGPSGTKTMTLGPPYASGRPDIEIRPQRDPHRIAAESWRYPDA